MTIAANAFMDDLGIQLGDPSNSLWPRTQLLSFIKRAYRISAPWFFKPTNDFTTYTGLNAVAINTNEILVPAAYLSSGSATDVDPPGEITGLKVRLTGTTTPVSPVPQVWFPVPQAEIEDLNQAAPKIKFLQPYNNIFELQIYGWKPLTIPAADASTALDGSNIRGFTEWLTFQCMVYCMANKETNTQDDKRGYGRRHLIDQADADKIRWRYRMSKEIYTSFVQIGR